MSKNMRTVPIVITLEALLLKETRIAIPNRNTYNPEVIVRIMNIAMGFSRLSI